MKITNIAGTSISDCWFRCLYQLIEQAKIKDGVSRYTVSSGSDPQQDRIEFDFAIVHIKQPWIRPLIPILPEHLNLPPVSDEKYLNEYMLYLLTSDKQPNEDYTYGERIMVGWDEVVRRLQEKDYNTNQLCLSVSKPEDIFLGDPPCLRQIDIRVDNNVVNFIVYFRSWNLFNGFPNNLAALQQAKELICAETGLEDGEIIALSKGLNIRAYNLETVFMLLQKDIDLEVGK